MLAKLWNIALRTTWEPCVSRVTTLKTMHAVRIGEIWKISWINGASFSSFCSHTFTPDFDYLVLPFNNLHSFGNKQLHFLSVACEKGVIRQQMSGQVQLKKGESALSF
jgi:hypothetical protein